MAFDKKKWATHKKAMEKDWDTYKTAERSSFEMPGPIRNGVARLTNVEFKDPWLNEDTGEEVDIVEIEGVIVLPSEHKGKKVRVSHFLQESQYATLEEAYSRLIIDLRSVGVSMDDPDKVDASVNAAIKKKAAFTFNTKIAKKSKKIFCEIVGPAKTEDSDSSDSEESPAKKAPPVEKDWSAEDPFGD